MISKLLRKNVSAWQLGAYATACLVGLSILLVSLSFYADVRSIRNSSESVADYIVLSKPVNMLAALGYGNADAMSFTPTEIADLRQQPWVKRVGEFTSAGFNISASVEFAGRGLSTALFFESLPDDFVDIDSASWQFDPIKAEIPILVPRDYLALYNFGFAASRGMPQISEELIKQVPIKIALGGNGHYEILPARIAGLSSRLNTIAVPESFMQWASERFGNKNQSQQPARLIVELANPGDPAIKQWLKDNDIESSADSMATGQTAYIAAVCAAVVGIIGIVIATLAVMILLLSIFLLIQKNSDKIRDLTLLGYSRAQVGRFYRKLILFVNSIVTVGAIAVTITISPLWREALESFGKPENNALLIVLCAIIIMSIVSAVAIYACNTMIKKAAR
ncbi:MAG: ABC transporter permease [Muribaculaceae bacterium]|nr:ABC transporter permease [Muribaculaceae bacterium]